MNHHAKQISAHEFPGNNKRMTQKKNPNNNVHHRGEPSSFQVVFTSLTMSKFGGWAKNIGMFRMEYRETAEPP